jgi:hypothetical protein
MVKIKLFERKKKFPVKGKELVAGRQRATREDYEKDSYRWCYRQSAAPKLVNISVERVAGKFVKKKVVVDSEVTFQA